MSDKQIAAQQPPDNKSLLAAAMSGAAENTNALSRALSTRETASILTAALVAKQFPRDEIIAMESIKRACGRIRLARAAAYSYNRGGTAVSGPSIRLAEAIAQAWSNIRWGWEEIDRNFSPEKGVMVSKVRAYARDSQSNSETERIFDVPHWRDTKKSESNPHGGYALADERDIYELCANQASRRVRACILTIIPGDICDEAEAWCEETIKNHEGKRPLQDRIRDMLIAYQAIGVSKEMIADRLTHNVESMTEPEFRVLGKTYVAIQDGYTKVEKEFTKAAQPNATKAPTEGEKPPAPAESKPAPKPRRLPQQKPAPAAPEAPAADPVRDALLGQLSNRATLEDFVPNEFAEWARANKYDGAVAGGLDSQPVEVLQELVNFIDECAEGIVENLKR